MKNGILLNDVALKKIDNNLNSKTIRGDNFEYFGLIYTIQAAFEISCNNNARNVDWDVISKYNVNIERIKTNFRESGGDLQ